MARTKAAPPAEPPVQAGSTRLEAQTRFVEIQAALEAGGWFRLYVDTYGHGQHDATNRLRPTIRHHYTAGTFELYAELDARWNRPSKTPTVKLTVGKPLPTVAEALADLYAALYG